MTDLLTVIETFLWDNYPTAHDHAGSHREDAQQLLNLIERNSNDRPD